MIKKIVYLRLRYAVLSTKLKLYYWLSKLLCLLVIESGFENMIVFLDCAPEYFRKMR